MEYWSLYDEKMNICVRKHRSTEPIPEGLYHLSVEVWPFDGQRFFLTQRSYKKNRYPGFWECTGGSALAGESFIEAAIREVHEELGIVTNEKAYKLLKTDVKDKHIVSVYLLKIDSNTRFTFSSNEIEAGKWHTVQEMESLHLDTYFVPFQFERYIQYVRKEAFNFYINNKPISVSRVLSEHPELCVPKRGLPYLGKRPDGQPFTGVLGTISNAFEVYGDTLYTKKTVLPETINNSLGSGSPLPLLPFPPIVDAINRVMSSNILSQYGFPAGDIKCRRTICDYLHKEGFSKYITPDNIIFTESTTHAFHMILQLIVQPGDVVLFSAPTYGLFAFEPERLGGNSRFIPLCAEDDWIVNPRKLAEVIDSINLELSSENKKNHIPRVVAFFQENPHNPIGKVMGIKQKALVLEIAKVCRERQVFVIDDLLYRDLGYDRENIALPAAHFDSEYQNVISLLGLSKAYGLAGLRAGFIVADEVIIRGIRNSVFQNIDSTSHLNAIALEAAFNCSLERQKAYDDYFSAVLEQYKFNFNLVKAAVNGVNCLSGEYKKNVIDFVSSILGNKESDKWLRPMEGVDFVPGTIPESGFFCLLDFSTYKGKKFGNTCVIDDLSFLDYMFSRYRVNFITGKSIGWPDPEAIIARISFSGEASKIVRVFSYMKEELMRLE